MTPQLALQYRHDLDHQVLITYLKYVCYQVDRSSEEPDGEADRTNHYAEGGSGTKGSSPGKQNAGSESPKPGRRRHSRRSSQDFEMMMRAEMMIRAITMFTKSKITKFIPLAGIVHWCQYPWTSLEWQIMKMTTYKDVTNGTLCVKFYRPLAGPVQGTGWLNSKS